MEYPNVKGGPLHEASSVQNSRRGAGDERTGGRRVNGGVPGCGGRSAGESELSDRVVPCGPALRRGCGGGGGEKQLSDDFTAQTAALAQLPEPVPDAVQNDFETVTLADGQSTPVSAGGELMLLAGQASASAGLVDATTGTPVASGTALQLHHLYVAAADSSVSGGAGCQILLKS